MGWLFAFDLLGDEMSFPFSGDGLTSNIYALTSSPYLPLMCGFSWPGLLNFAIQDMRKPRAKPVFNVLLSERESPT